MTYTKEYSKIRLLALFLSWAFAPFFALGQNDAPILAPEEISKTQIEYRTIKKNEVKNDSLVQQLIIAKYSASELIIDNNVTFLDNKDSISLWLRKDSTYSLTCGKKEVFGKWQLLLTKNGYYMVTENESKPSEFHPLYINYNYDFIKEIPIAIRSLVFNIQLPCDESGHIRVVFKPR